MQYNDDSPKSSRPTLLTPAQQAEADRHRILSQLESGKAGKPTARRTQSKLLWLVSGALLVAIAALLGMWANQNNQADLHLAALSTATDGSIANSAAAAAVAAAAAGTTAAATTATGMAVATTAPASDAGQVSSNASAAMIQEDHAAQAQDKKQTESGMLDSRSEVTGTASTSTSTSKHDANLLSSALERPTAVVAKPPPQHKTARKEKPKAKPASVAKAPRAKQKQQQREPEKSSPEEENDVALLAALVSHIQSEERQAAPPRKPRLSLDEQLSQCKKLSKTKAAQCHARVCDGRSKTGGCKVKK